VTGTGAGKAGRVRPRTRLALRPLRRVTIAHADALAHHEEEAKEDEAADDDEGKTNQEKAAAEEVKVEEGDAEWDADDDEGKPGRGPGAAEEEDTPSTRKRSSTPTPTRGRTCRRQTWQRQRTKDAAADHPGTDECFSGHWRLVFYLWRLLACLLEFLVFSIHRLLASVFRSAVTQ